MRPVLFLLLFLPETLLAQACLGSKMNIDPSCQCRASNNCFKYHTPDYLNALKKTGADKEKKVLKTILGSQKATGQAFNKIMSNMPVSEQELLMVRKEGAALERLNKANLQVLNKMRAKKSQRPIDPEARANENEKRFLSSLSPSFRQKLNRPVKAAGLNMLAKRPVGPASNDDEAEDVSFGPSESEDKLIVEARNDTQNELHKIKNSEFDYWTEISNEKSASIFHLISVRYRKSAMEGRFKYFHVNDEKELSLKSEISDDIKNIVRIHTLRPKAR